MTDARLDASVPAPGIGEGLVHGAARRAGSIPSLTLAQRRSRFLRALAPHMGAWQLEHLTIHCEQVGRAAGRIAALMRLPAHEVEQVRMAGLLHDIGKALVPDAVLGREGPLNVEERRILDRHDEDGAVVCGLLGAPPAIVEAVRFHHRRAVESPVAARIIRVADALSVMTTGRCYSAARTYTQALAELRDGRGGDFDPDAVVAAHILGASVMALAA